MIRKRELSDEATVKQVLGGETEAYSILVDRYLPAVNALAFAKTGNRVEAEDVSQEAFVRGLENLHHLREPAKFGPWILSTARNVAASALRSALSRRRSLEKYAGRSEALEVSAVEEEELHALLRREVMALDDTAREVLVLYYFAENSVKEMSRLLEISEEAAKKRLQRAREALTKSLLGQLEAAFEPIRPSKDQSATIMGIATAIPLPWGEAGVAASGSTTAAWGGGASLGGILVMKKAIVGIGLFTALALLGFLGLNGEEEKRTVASSPSSAIESVSVASADEPPDDSAIVKSAPPVLPATTTEPVSPASAVIKIEPASLTGRVVDSNGAPLSGWRIWGVPTSRSEPSETDALGMFNVSGIKPGDYKLYASDPVTGARTEVVAPLTLGPGEHLPRVKLVHFLGKSITGYITDSNNLPVPGALIFAWLTLPDGSSGGSAISQAKTDEQGFYEVASIPETEGIKVHLRINCRNYMDASFSGILVDGTEQDFTLFEVPTIEGRVLDAVSRNPINEYRLNYWVGGPAAQEGLHLGNTARREMETHMEGAFSFKIPGFGQVRIAIAAPGYITNIHRLEEVRPGATVGGIEILMDRATPLTGTVVNYDGSPVPNAHIFLGYPILVRSDNGSTRVQGAEGIARSDSLGTFTVTEYPATLNLISAFHPDYAPGWTAIRGTSSRVEILLPQGSGVEGIVTIGGVPPKNGSVHISILADDDSPIMQTVTGEGGRYSMELVPTGSLRVSAGLREGIQRRFLRRDMTVMPGEPLQHDFDFDESYDSFVVGTVLLDGFPLPSASLRGEIEFENGDRAYYQTETTAGGGFRLGPIPAVEFEFGAASIRLEDGSFYEPAFETIVTRPDETTYHDIILVSD
jgi:RNA polymerase sigma factor (sigma-70 family)